VFAFCPSVCFGSWRSPHCDHAYSRYLILNVFVAVLTSGIADADESSSDAAAMSAQSNKSQQSTGAQARPRLAAPDPAHRTAPHREW
jgi:hypothetical protein